MDIKAIAGIITAAITAIGGITVAVINNSEKDPSKVKVIDSPTTVRNPVSKESSGKVDMFQEPDGRQYPLPPSKY